MGKHGPCHHCGITSTPLWRNGPPEKPVLCNACGSRWRTKGTLAKYTPLHARVDHDELEGYGVSKVNAISVKNKEAHVFKRKYDTSEFGGDPLDYKYNEGFHKRFDKGTSNGSSSGSTISNLEHCTQDGSADGGDFSGPSNLIAWDATVPSKKRTCINPSKPSSVEKLMKDLYTIWNKQQLSSVSGSSEEDLVLASSEPMISVEIGHGGVLIRHPSSIAREEESEVSSLSTDNKFHSVNPRKLNCPLLMEDTSVNSSSGGIDKIKKPANPCTEQVQMRRDEDWLEKIQRLLHHNSPLCHVNLQNSKTRESAKEVEVFGGFSSTLPSDHSSSEKVTRRGQHRKLSGADSARKIPGRMSTKPVYNPKEVADYNESFSSTKILSSSPNSTSCFTDGSSEHDLLLDVSPNGYLPQAELLPPGSSFCAQTTAKQ